MLEYNEVVERKYIVLDGQPYEVISSHVFRKQQRKPVNATITQLLFKEKPLGFKYPITAELKVTEAPPGVRGDTATGGSKPVVLETGAVINVPLFVAEGDIIRLNTETGEYRERIGK